MAADYGFRAACFLLAQGGFAHIPSGFLLRSHASHARTGATENSGAALKPGNVAKATCAKEKQDDETINLSMPFGKGI